MTFLQHFGNVLQTLVLVLGTSLCFSLPAWLFWEAIRPFSWSNTAGTVVSSTVVKGNLHRVTYTLTVVYTYTVNGKLYESNTLSNGPTWASKDLRSVKRKASRFTPSQSINVYYNPRNPEQAVIELFSLSLPTFGLLSLVGVVILCINIGAFLNATYEVVRSL
jgi:Protein of unknown function (DUF3592)